MVATEAPTSFGASGTIFLLFGYDEAAARYPIWLGSANPSSLLWWDDGTGMLFVHESMRKFNHFCIINLLLES